MSDGNSWCTCTKKLPQGWNTKGCPVHDRDDDGYTKDDPHPYDYTDSSWSTGRGDSMG